MPLRPFDTLAVAAHYASKEHPSSFAGELSVAASSQSDSRAGISAKAFGSIKLLHEFPVAFEAEAAVHDPPTVPGADTASSSP